MCHCHFLDYPDDAWRFCMGWWMDSWVFVMSVVDDSLNVGDSSVLMGVLSRFDGLLKVGHMNVGSVALSQGSWKLDELRSLFAGSLLDMFGFSETWMKSHVTNRAVEFDGYRIYRNDRPGRRGGGVCIYIKRGISSK